MTTLIIGGSASGKSEYAEHIITKGNIPRYYIATMQPFDKESINRIKRHRTMRKNKNFDTIECYTGLKNIFLPERADVLLECMSNLAANEMFSPEGAGENALNEIISGVENIQKQCENLVIVSNEVFLGGNKYQGDTYKYLKLLADINRAIADKAENVCEIVCAQPFYYKGKEPL